MENLYAYTVHIKIPGHKVHGPVSDTISVSETLDHAYLKL